MLTLHLHSTCKLQNTSQAVYAAHTRFLTAHSVLTHTAGCHVLRREERPTSPDIHEKINQGPDVEWWLVERYSAGVERSCAARLNDVHHAATTTVLAQAPRSYADHVLFWPQHLLRKVEDAAVSGLGPQLSQRRPAICLHTCFQCICKLVQACCYPHTLRSQPHKSLTCTAVDE